MQNENSYQTSVKHRISPYYWFIFYEITLPLGVRVRIYHQTLQPSADALPRRRKRPNIGAGAKDRHTRHTRRPTRPPQGGTRWNRYPSSTAGRGKVVHKLFRLPRSLPTLLMQTSGFVVSTVPSPSHPPSTAGAFNSPPWPTQGLAPDHRRGRAARSHLRSLTEARNEGPSSTGARKPQAKRAQSRNIDLPFARFARKCNW